MIIEILLRDKKGNIFLQKKDVECSPSLVFGDNIKEFYDVKPRHVFIKLNKVLPSIGDPVVRYDNGIKIDSNVRKEYGFDCKSRKGLKKGIKSFVKDKLKEYGKEHPIGDFFKDKSDLYIYIDQKKGDVEKNFNILSTEKYNNLVRKNAEKIWLKTGCVEGRDVENWEQAERNIKEKYSLI